MDIQDFTKEVSSKLSTIQKIANYIVLDSELLPGSHPIRTKVQECYLSDLTKVIDDFKNILKTNENGD